MSTINNGGPAFPVSTGNPDEPHQNGHSTAQFPGMTLRDYFAAKALPAVIDVVIRSEGSATTKDGSPMDEVAISRQAYYFADAMLKAREA